MHILLEDFNVLMIFWEISNFLLNSSSRTNIGINKMGELDEKVFLNVCKKRFPHQEEAPTKAMELCSLWQENLKDSNWHPFKVIIGQYLFTGSETTSLLLEV
ncbi:hypothetical protein PIB30_050737 [Stylosanthes scabra]|uniref:Factor of DNA methylation 1-5/IDN2 domain-containing protein n=1 Tax=Stylosanthes scabra TaxID=79078 RepID=A0ABU6QIA5_9FABA|nr:hypothetical protein [Stylosanthes scabra]